MGADASAGSKPASAIPRPASCSPRSSTSRTHRKELPGNSQTTRPFRGADHCRHHHRGRGGDLREVPLVPVRPSCPRALVDRVLALSIVPRGSSDGCHILQTARIGVAGASILVPVHRLGLDWVRIFADRPGRSGGTPESSMQWSILQTTLNRRRS